MARSCNRRNRRNNVPAARELRRQLTPAEAVLWRALRGRRLGDAKFRRQHPVGPFVLDFCCPNERLGIELHGPIHASQVEHDTNRENLLEASGYRVLRFANDEVLGDLESVLERIRLAFEHAARGKT